MLNSLVTMLKITLPIAKKSQDKLYMEYGYVCIFTASNHLGIKVLNLIIALDLFRFQPCY